MKWSSQFIGFYPREPIKTKRSLNRSSWGSTGSLAIGAFNALAGYHCFDQTYTGGRSGKRVFQPGKERYWMRECVFNTPRSDLDRTRATGRLVPQSVEPVGQSLDRFSILALKTYLFLLFSFLTLR